MAFPRPSPRNTCVGQFHPLSESIRLQNIRNTPRAPFNSLMQDKSTQLISLLLLENIKMLIFNDRIILGYKIIAEWKLKCSGDRRHIGSHYQIIIIYIHLLKVNWKQIISELASQLTPKGPFTYVVYTIISSTVEACASSWILEISSIDKDNDNDDATNSEYDWSNEEK